MLLELLVRSSISSINPLHRPLALGKEEKSRTRQTRLTTLHKTPFSLFSVILGLLHVELFLLFDFEFKLTCKYFLENFYQVLFIIVYCLYRTLLTNIDMGRFSHYIST